jgi:hypothetical protein
MWVRGGKGMCPQDGLMLQRYSGENIPQNIVVQRCVRCGKWWFPGDYLFQYKPAIESKINYFRSWGITADLASMVLPILSLVVLVGGITATVGMVRYRQQAETQATAGVQGFAARYLGEGKEQLLFRSTQPVMTVEVRRFGSQEGWVTKETIQENGVHVVNLENLSDQMKYEVRIRGKVYGFETQ